MTLKIVGAGFGRTGTLSLKQALETLGFDMCYHMIEVGRHPRHVQLWRAAWRGEPVWDELFEGYQAAVDWPVAAFWPKLMDYYPESKILLSVRDAEGWYKSAKNTIFGSMSAPLASDDEQVLQRVLMAKEIIVDGTFDGDLDDKENCIAVYAANTARAKAEVPADRLIVFEAAQGWAPLCAALDCPVPDVPYPKVNTTGEFEKRWRRQ